MNVHFNLETYLSVLREQGKIPEVSVKLAEALLAVTLSEILKEKGFEIVDGKMQEVLKESSFKWNTPEENLPGDGAYFVAK